MHKARLIVFEGFVRLLGTGWAQITQVAHAVASQAAIQARAGDIRVDELVGDRQQVIERRQQRLAQLNNHSLLSWVEPGEPPRD